MEIEGSLPCSQQPTITVCPEQDESSRHLPIFSSIHSDIIFPCTPRSSEWSLQAFRWKFCVHFSSFPCVLHAMPISYALIWWPWWYLVKRTNYKGFKHFQAAVYSLNMWVTESL